MDRDEVRRAIAAERRSLADLLEQLSDEEWNQRSLCVGWTVREVVAHLTLGPQFSLLTGLAELARARGDVNRLIHDTAQRHATRPVGELVAQLRQFAASRRRPPGTSYLDPLTDVLVHGQDIAVPLGREREMPKDAARSAADRVSAMGFPFHARRTLRGLRLIATDVEWAVGDGLAVQGPIEAILLLLTGRTVTLPRLTGPGKAELAARLSVRSSTAG